MCTWMNTWTKYRINMFHHILESYNLTIRNLPMVIKLS